MKVLVFLESDEGSIKKSSLEAVSYAAEMTKDAVAIIFGVLDRIELNKVGVAGGKKVLTGNATFRRYSNDGTLDSRTFSVNKNEKRGSYKNPYLNNGDMIFIGKSKFNVASEVLSTITSPFTSIITAGTAYKLFSD